MLLDIFFHSLPVSHKVRFHVRVPARLTRDVELNSVDNQYHHFLLSIYSKVDYTSLVFQVYF